MNTTTIRDTTFDDIPKLRAMHGASWRDTYPNEEHSVSQEWVNERTAAWVTPEGMERSREHFKDVFGHPDHLHKVAVSDGEIVGFVHVSKKEKGYYLAALYVDKKYHGSGLAQRLMDEALDWCDTSKPIDLEVAIYNERAKVFYRKYGFKEVPGTEDIFADIIPIITMERKGEAR